MNSKKPLDEEFIALLQSQKFPQGLDTGLYLRQVYNIVSALTSAILKNDDDFSQHVGGIGPHFAKLRKSDYPVYLLLQFVMESSAAASAESAVDQKAAR